MDAQKIVSMPAQADQNKTASASPLGNTNNPSQLAPASPPSTVPSQPPTTYTPQPASSNPLLAPQTVKPIINISNSYSNNQNNPSYIKPLQNITTQTQNPVIPPKSIQQPTANLPRRSPDLIGTKAGQQQPKNNYKKIIPFVLTPIVLTTLILSFFFYTNQRQPQTSSRASAPSPTLSLSNLSHISPTSSQLTNDNRQPTTISFGSLISGSPDNSNQQTTDNRQLITDNPQPTTDLPAQAGNRPLTTDNTLLTLPPATPKPGKNVSYEIKIANNSFDPGNINVYQGQLVDLYILAGDKTYDIFVSGLNLNISIPQGSRTPMEFQALGSGKYTFECKTNCSPPATLGTLIINPI